MSRFNLKCLFPEPLQALWIFTFPYMVHRYKVIDSWVFALNLSFKKKKKIRWKFSPEHIDMTNGTFNSKLIIQIRQSGRHCFKGKTVLLQIVQWVKSQKSLPFFIWTFWLSWCVCGYVSVVGSVLCSGKVIFYRNRHAVRNIIYYSM